MRAAAAAAACACAVVCVYAVRGSQASLRLQGTERGADLLNMIVKNVPDRTSIHPMQTDGMNANIAMLPFLEVEPSRDISWMASANCCFGLKKQTVSFLLENESCLLKVVNRGPWKSII